MLSVIEKYKIDPGHQLEVDCPGKASLRRGQLNVDLREVKD